jgi:hypothetical protein
LVAESLEARPDQGPTGPAVVDEPKFRITFEAVTGDTL